MKILRKYNGICRTSGTPPRDQTYESWFIEEKDEIQAKGIVNIFSHIIVENFPNVEREGFTGKGGFQNTKQVEPEKKQPDIL
jgi:hypothetical protein